MSLIPHNFSIEQEVLIHPIRLSVNVNKQLMTMDGRSVKSYWNGQTFPHAHAILFPAFPVEQDIFIQLMMSVVQNNPLERITEAELDEIAAKLRSL